jgi:DNA helicase IV
MDRHPELDAEQRYLDHAYACLAAMRARTAGTVAVAERTALQEGTVDAGIVLWHLERRAQALAETPAALCFGRLDEETGERIYIGRRHVEDADNSAVVVDWRARASTPFYRATFADPMGLERRRRFVVEGHTLVDLFDEDFTDPATATHGGGIPDPLLAELERARTGEMRDIVATIQAEQDVVIRAPLDELIVVQGGPGTGKTAVGLHRAAFLLYEHRDLLERRRLLVVGPNRIFLRYIAQVLPSLGETAVVQATIDGLVGIRYPVRGTDPPAVARLKGDGRMAEVLGRAVAARIQPPAGDVAVTTRFGVLRLAHDEVAGLMATVLGRNLASNEGREVFRQLLLQRAERVHGVELSTTEARPLRAVADKAWPSLSAPALVRGLLGNRRTLAAAADGVLTADEQALLVRRPSARVGDERWTMADLGLLDEAEALTSGTAVTYGHVVVDEAQDLSAMELRMLARRSPERSMTVLGDLAQATGIAAQERWEDAIEALAAPKARLEELALGYRVPGPVLDFANRLLPEAAPHVRPARSVRLAGEPPLVLAVDAAALAHTVATEVASLLERWASVGVIGPASLLDDLAAALTAAGIEFGDARRGAGLDAAVTLLPPPAAKGLEFDAVVVAEPAGIVAEEPSGVRILYVALTRAVQHLGVIHAEPLPAALAAAAAAAG